MTQTMNQWLKDNPRNCARGAPMGRSPEPLLPGAKVRIERLQWVDGDYTLDGTYWGRDIAGKEYIYAIWSPEGHNPDQKWKRHYTFMRAKSRDEAVAYAVKEGYVPLRGLKRQ